MKFGAKISKLSRDNKQEANNISSHKKLRNIEIISRLVTSKATENNLERETGNEDGEDFDQRSKRDTDGKLDNKGSDADGKALKRT